MKQIENAVKTLFGPDTSICGKIFYPSKKNQVTRLCLERQDETFQVMAKFFVWGDAAHEEHILNECRTKEIPVPRPLHREDNLLLLEYIRGSALTWRDMRNPLILRALANWIALLHRSFLKEGVTLLKRDMRLHNFILKDGILWGVDFEEAGPGKIEEDLADLCATFLEGGTPGFSGRNLSLIRRFLREYGKELREDNIDLQNHAAANLRARATYHEASAETYLQWAEKFERGEISF